MLDIWTSHVCQQAGDADDDDDDDDDDGGVQLALARVEMECAMQCNESEDDGHKD